MQIPESVSSDSLRKRAEILRGSMDESAAHHMELAADEIEQLQEVIRKVKLLATCESLSIDGYRNAMEQIRAEAK
jgi:hypothetical protein